MEHVRAEVTYSCHISCLMLSSLPCPHHRPFPGVLCAKGPKGPYMILPLFFNYVIYSFVPFGMWLMYLTGVFFCSPHGTIL